MIEQVIYFALGCCVTGLLALLFAPVFWQRALRLTRQRLQLQVPLSMQEILAQRDQLRAEFAVERLRVEQALDAVQDGKGRDMAEIGRRTMEIVALSEEVATFKATVAVQEKALDDAHRTGDERGTELAALNARLQENETKLGEYRHRAESAETDRSRLLSETDSQRTSIASLKTVGMGLEIRLSDGERALAAEREAAGTLRSRLETAMEHAARHESAGLLTRRELDEARERRRQTEADLAAAQAAMKTERDAHDKAVADHAGVVQDHGKVATALRYDLDESRRRAGKALAELDIAQAALAETRTRLRERDDALGAAQTVLRERDDVAVQDAARQTEREALIVTTRRDLDALKADNLRLSEGLSAAQKADEEAREAVAARDVEAQAGEAAALADALVAARAETALVTKDLTARVDDALRRLAAAEAARDAAALDLAKARTPEEDGASLRRQLADSNARAGLLQNQLGAAQARLEEAARERLAIGEAGEAARAEQASANLQLRRDLDDARAQNLKLDEKLNQANVLLGEARETIEQRRDAGTPAFQAELAAARRALDEASEREKAAAIQRSLQTDKDRRAERRVKERMEALAAENAAMKAALAGAGPAERGASEATIGAERDEAGLRESIHALGLAVARLTRDTKDEAVAGRRSRADEDVRPIGVA